MWDSTRTELSIACLCRVPSFLPRSRSEHRRAAEYSARDACKEGRTFPSFLRIERIPPVIMPNAVPADEKPRPVPSSSAFCENSPLPGTYPEQLSPTHMSLISRRAGRHSLEPSKIRADSLLPAGSVFPVAPSLCLT